MVEGNRPHEVIAFLPQNDKNKKVRNGNKYELQDMISKDLEGAIPLSNINNFDPFTERQVNNPTSDCQTLTHLLKSTLGTGIMSMPYAFKSAGYVGGSLGVVFMMLICTHTSYILIDCAHKLYYRTRQTKMEYADVVEAAFATGPPWSRKFTKFARYFLQIWLFSAYFGASSTDNLLIAKNFGQVIEYYTEFANGTEVNATTVAELAKGEVGVPLMRLIMTCMLPVVILFVWVPDLKYLAPISMLANFSMAAGLLITLYYVVQEPLPLSKLSVTRPISEFPEFFSVTLFAMENIGVMMPLENNMATPRNLLGKCGVLNRAMFCSTFVYLLLGLLGYMKYGESVDAVISTNLPVGDITAQAVKILIGSTVLLTFGLQFYVCHEMVWNRIKDYFPNRPILAEYSLRTALVVACVSLSIAIPKIGPLVRLIGALGFSLIGILYPVIMEMIVYWDIGFGRLHWKIYKNVVLILIGILAIIFGSQSAINEIIDETSK